MVSPGHIYKGNDSCWYSVSDKAFLGTDDVTDITASDGQAIKVK